jgi:hypothetical protein
VFRLQALGALLHFELNLDAIVQAAVAVHFYGAEMDKNILAAGALDESIAFGIVEPLNDTFLSHYILSCADKMLRTGALEVEDLSPAGWKAARHAGAVG